MLRSSELSSCSPGVAWAEINGVSLRYSLAGDADRPGIVLVHEIGGSIESWGDVARELRDDHRVLCYDQRGSGLSERVTRIGVGELVRDLELLAEREFGTERIYLVGVALGAAICIAFALAHPERVAGLVLGSPTVRVSPQVILTLQERAETILRGGMRAVVDESLRKSYPAEFRENGERFGQYRLRWLANDPESFCAMSQVPAQLPLAGDPRNLNCPVLLLGAIGDVIRTAADVAKLANQIPNARFSAVEGGHFLHLQNPRAVVDHVRDFVRQTDSGRLSANNVGADRSLRGPT
ncbi:3-oxoadipate enol-lactonase [Bradyrhizobium sp. USDA 4449]